MLLVELNLVALIPLNITITKKILNYILYIKSKHKESFVTQFFLMSFDIKTRIF